MTTDLIAKLTPELEANIRSGINWRYKDTVGTSSHERNALIGEIDRLRKERDALAEQVKVLRDSLEMSRTHVLAAVSIGCPGANAELTQIDAALATGGK